VYATSFLLVTVIVGLNLTAIGIRNHLREKIPLARSLIGPANSFEVNLR
jgi:hypothetical protein